MGELEPNLIGNDPPAQHGLFGTGSPGDPAAATEEGQRETDALLRHVAADPVAGSIFLGQVLEALAATWRRKDYYAVVNDADVAIQIPVLGQHLDGWTLDHVVTWCPTSNVGATVNVIFGGGQNIQGGNMFKLPAAIAASKVIAQTLVGLPVTEPEVTSMSVTGTAGDRVAVIFVYKRGG